MGKPKFSRKKYDTPNHPWKAERIKSENELQKKYGLKNKREIWKAETSLRRYREQARELLAKMASDDPQAKKETDQLIIHLTRYSILPLNSTLDDVLALDTEAILARRLQTISYLKGFANTPHQARQLIGHGHLAIDGRRITIPGYRVTKEEEGKIDYAIDSPLNDVAHPARPSGEFKSKLTVTAIDNQKDRTLDAPIAVPAKPQVPLQKQPPQSKETQSTHPPKGQTEETAKAPPVAKPSEHKTEKTSHKESGKSEKKHETKNESTKGGV